MCLPPALAPCFISHKLFTSEVLANAPAHLVVGTTGLPKGVEITHFQIVCNILQIKEALFSNKNVNQRVALCALPFYHGLGLLYYGLMAPKFRVKVYVMERYSVMEMLEYIERFAVTELLLVPPMLVALAKHPDARSGKYNLKSVSKVVVGAAPLGREVTEQFEELWHGTYSIVGSGCRLPFLTPS